ncbi:acyl-CoA thioesterase [Persicirhabdus sediminis]|uniref:Acyl-CoA thioesterase n=1 Tax=Persicirhabdus sediminis TaxID=454144 RepID=A0A8J7SM95_9BACT|nr:thioesterase family protein [Persicirhabdus sediminis]MBK1792836.1 acyl-CoA thioesterase [Persicirhabdus sediminis]
MPSLTVTRKVAFSDTDAAGVVHFSKILCYAEDAEHELLESLGLAVFQNCGWPRVHIDCDYRAPLVFGDIASIDIELAETGRTSVSWKFSIKKGGQLIATGTSKNVYLDAKGIPQPIPAALLS